MDTVAALIIKDDKILIAQRKEGDEFSLLWEFPGGRIRKGETKKQALKREISEELGVKIEVVELIDVFEDKNNSSTITIYLYRCKIVRGRPHPLDCHDLRWTSLEGLKDFNLASADCKIADYLEQKTLDR